MVFKNFHKISVFLRKFPIFREFLAFFDFFYYSVFAKSMTLYPQNTHVSRFHLFCEWLVLNIMLNGVLWYIVVVIFIGFPSNGFMTFIMPLGIGLFRFLVFDVLDSIMQVITRKRR